MDKRAWKRKRIGVLMGGKSSEREISLNSGNAILNSLLRNGYNATGIDAKDNLIDTLSGKKIDVAFISLHGRWGEDGTVQGLCEIMGIPYTGSGVLGSSIAMDKTIMKYILTGLDIPTPEYAVFTRKSNIKFPMPFVVKPAGEGSTIGVSIVKTKKEKDDAIEKAFTYDKKILIERYIDGPEITVGIVNGKMLPIIEVKPLRGFYDFEAKYTKGMTEYIVPARISKSVEKGAYAISSRIYESLELSGCVRIDMLVDNNTPRIIDINTSPGMTETSLVPKAWGYMGKTFDELVEELLMGATLKL